MKHTILDEDMVKIITANVEQWQKNDASIVHKGGEGSGNFNHAGIPGHQGGSQPKIINSLEDIAPKETGTMSDRELKRAGYEWAQRVIDWNRHIYSAQKKFAKGKILAHVMPYHDKWRALVSDVYQGNSPYDVKDFNTIQEAYDAAVREATALSNKHYPELTGKIVHKGGPGSGNEGHAGIPGHQGGSMPRQLQRGSGGEVQARQQQRVAIMQTNYPGIKFSLATYNPLGLEYAKREGKLPPGLDLPQAIYDRTLPKITDAVVLNKVIESNHKWGGASGYTRLNTLKFDTGLSFEEIMGSITELHERDPYKVTLTVDRLGKATAVKFARNWTVA